MGFIQRAFTPPGTGGAEAAGIQAQADIKAATDKLSAIAPPPTPPTLASIGQAPTPPPQFMPGAAGSKRAGGAAKSPTSFLGAPADTGSRATKSLLGQ